MDHKNKGDNKIKYKKVEKANEEDDQEEPFYYNPT